MTSTTLRGIFPDPKPIHRRNFVRENIRHLKEMQGFIQQEAKLQSESQEIKPNKFKHVAPKVYNTATFKKISREQIGKRPYSHGQFSKNFRPAMCYFYNKNTPQSPQKIIHRGVQTERPEDIPKLYETGVLKFPSPSILPQSNKQSPTSPKRGKDQGDAPQNLVKNMQKLDLNEKPNHIIKRNIKNLKTKSKAEETPDPTVPPANYQKGVLPKYLKDKKEIKEDMSRPIEYEGENLSGLVLLPDDERKEYLRVARENYAALIRELNCMPVSNDTLKRRKRKMEIEDELKRLDEVIKIFQKPKVFVKADM